MDDRERIVGRKAGEIVTGRFEQGRGYAVLRERGTDDWLLIHTLGGRGRFGHAGGELVVRPGQTVLIRPGVRHDYGVEPGLERWVLLWVHFLPRPPWLEWLNWPEEAPGLMRLAVSDRTVRRRVVRSLSRAHELATGALRRRETFAMNALEEALLWFDVANAASRPGRVDERVRRVMEHMCRRLSASMSLKDLAEVGGLSVSRLSHLFREQTGSTPQQFLELQRLNRARQLLELTPLPVQAVAAEVGFVNAFYFTLRFKRHVGVSPRGYRARLARGG